MYAFLWYIDKALKFSQEAREENEDNIVIQLNLVFWMIMSNK